MHIFISYAKEDTTDLVKILAEHLENLPTVTAWWDSTLNPGDSWSAQIQDEIKRCDLFMVLLSADVNRPRHSEKGTSFVQREINYAQNQGKKILPVMAEQTDLPVQIADLQYIDVSQSQEEGVRKVLEHVANLADVPAPKSTKSFNEQPFGFNRVSLTGRLIAGIVGLALIISAAVFVLQGDTNKSETGEPGYPDGANITQNNAWEPVTRGFESGNGTVVNMVLVPKGCFQMGNDPEAWYFNGGWIQGVPDGGEVCFDEPFWIDKYEVSNVQFTSLNGRASTTSGFDDGNLPRENILWSDANQFCRNNRNGRLPTEAEWEYALRGPESWAYPWGNEFIGTRLNCLNTSGNCADDGFDFTAPITSFEIGQSWVGAYNLSGNVWEWVNTVYDPNKFPLPYDAEDGREAQDDLTSQRTVKGGSFDDTSSSARGAYRNGNDRDFTNALIGFRCVRDYEE